MKLLVTRRNGSTELLDFTPPLWVAADREDAGMWSVQDATGTDFYFNKSDGTYDGWGRAVMTNAEGEELLSKASESSKPPKVPVQ